MIVMIIIHGQIIINIRLLYRADINRNIKGIIVKIIIAQHEKKIF